MIGEADQIVARIALRMGSHLGSRAADLRLEAGHGRDAHRRLVTVHDDFAAATADVADQGESEGGC